MEGKVIPGHVNYTVAEAQSRWGYGQNYTSINNYIKEG